MNIYILALLLKLFLLIIIFFILFYVIYIIIDLKISKDVPFVPSNNQVAKLIIKHNLIEPNDRFLEIGSGTGNIIINICKNKSLTEAVGVENKKHLYIISKLISLICFSKKTKPSFINNDIKKYNIKRFNKIFLFMLPEFLSKIAMPKIKNECKKGTIVISNMFEFPENPWLKKIKIIPVTKSILSRKTQFIHIYEKVV